MPAFNEEQTIAGVIAETKAKLPGFDCVVVNDGSRDGTAAVASEAGAIVLSLPFNLGVGGAMRLGFKYALENGYANVVQVDADGQHDPMEVPRLLEQLPDADIVIGARFAGEGAYHAHGPRRWAMKLFAFVIGQIAHVRLTDATSGFKLSGPRAVRLFAENYPAEYLGDTIEALVIAARAGLSIKQVPVSMRERAGGVPSHHPVKAAVYLFRATIALAVALIRPKSRVRVGSSGS